MIFYYLLPLSLLVFGILAFGVNLPHWDDWGLQVEYLLRYAHAPSWQDLWIRHNEHRIPLLRAWIWISGQLKWGPKVLAMLASVLWALNLRLYARLCLSPSLLAVLPPWMPALFGLFILSFCQREVLFWGTTSTSYAVTIAGVLVFFEGLQNKSFKRSLLGFALVFLTFPGWLALLPFAWKEAIKVKRSWLWITPASAVLIWFYFFNAAPLSSPTSSAARAAVSAGEWGLGAAVFFLRLLGSSFVMTGKHQFALLHALAISLGLFFVGILLFSIRRAVQANTSAAGLQLALYASLVLAMIAAARGESGLDAAGLASRYTVFAVMAWFGLFCEIWQNGSKRFRPISILLLSMGLFMSGVNWGAEAFVRAPKIRAAQKVVQDVVQGGQPSDQDMLKLEAIHPSPAQVRALCEEASRLPSHPLQFLWD